MEDSTDTDKKIVASAARKAEDIVAAMDTELMHSPNQTATDQEQYMTLMIALGLLIGRRASSFADLPQAAEDVRLGIANHAHNALVTKRMSGLVIPTVSYAGNG